MPLVKHEIQPIFVSRGLDLTNTGAAYELECLANYALSNVLRQLSNLAKHATDVFEELITEANLVYEKSNALQERIDECKILADLTQMDSPHDQDTVHGSLNQTPYHRKSNADHIILDMKTLPLSLQARRAMCEQVPVLSLLDPYREDGTAALRTYTNPKYFLELWCQEITKNIHDEKERKREIRRRRRQQQRQNIARDQPVEPPKPLLSRAEQNRHKAQGEEFELYHRINIHQPPDPVNPLGGKEVPTDHNQPTEYQKSQYQHPSHDMSITQEAKPEVSSINQGSPQSPAPPLSPLDAQNQDYNNTSENSVQGQDDNLPLPPPDPNDMPLITQLSADIPPPPPPPPPPQFNPSIPLSSPTAEINGNTNSPLSSPFCSMQPNGANIPPVNLTTQPSSETPTPIPTPSLAPLKTPTPTLTLTPSSADQKSQQSPPPTDIRSDLLQLIQDKKLKPVTKTDEKQVGEPGSDSVDLVSILISRYKAVQLSDQETDDEDSDPDLDWN